MVKVVRLSKRAEVQHHRPNQQEAIGTDRFLRISRRDPRICRYGDKRTERVVHAINTTYPSLFLSTMLGIVPLTYVHVHIKSKRTRRSDWKLKSADCNESV